MRHIPLLLIVLVLLTGVLLARSPDLPTVNNYPSLFGTNVTGSDYDTVRPVHVDANGAVSVAGTIATTQARYKVGQPVFYKVSIATSAATLFSTVVGTIATDAQYLLAFKGTLVMGPASTTASAVTASGTEMADTTMLVEPGTAIDFGLVGLSSVATFSAIKYPLVAP